MYRDAFPYCVCRWSVMGKSMDQKCRAWRLKDVELVCQWTRPAAKALANNLENLPTVSEESGPRGGSGEGTGRGALKVAWG